MSDTKKMTRRLHLSAFFVILGVALTGCNNSEEKVASVCEGAKKTQENLQPLVIGQVAAFRIFDEPIKIGSLEFDNAESEKTDISQLEGQTVLMNLWATWCAPCRHEMPFFDQLEADMGGEEFSVVPVSIDLGEPEKPKAFYNEIGIKNLPFYHDGSMNIFNDLKKRSLVFGLPVTLLIDKEGCVLGNLNGPAQWASDDAKALMQEAINSQK